VFNGSTFLDFLKEIVRRSRRKVFLVIDNGPCHNLDEDGKRWLSEHRHRIELFRLPPYSPELNPIGRLEGHQEAHHPQPVLQDHRRAR
jgi:transposase